MYEKSFGIFLAALVSAASLLGCAQAPSVPVSQAPLASTRLGPVLDLFQVPTGLDRVAVAVDRRGRAHVIVAAAALDEVHHVLVEGDRAVRRQRVAEGVSLPTLSALVDDEDRLRLLIGGRYLVLTNGVWASSTDTPWAGYGLSVQWPRFVPGAPWPVWTFQVEGQMVGSAARWDWFAIGGGPAGIIFPWYGESRKQVVVAETTAPGGGLWNVLDPQDQLDAGNVRLGAAEDGSVLVVYDASAHFIVPSGRARFARIEQPEAAAADAAETRNAIRSEAIPLRAIEGDTALPKEIQTFGAQTALAVDPDSGMALVLRAHNDTSHAFWNGQWRRQGFPLKRFWEPRLIAAGGNAFHALVIGEAQDPWWGRGQRVIYLRFEKGVWSTPTEIGVADVASFWGAIWDTVQIGGDGGRQAFAVWPTDAGIVGRWIERLP